MKGFGGVKTTPDFKRGRKYASDTVSKMQSENEDELIGRMIWMESVILYYYNIL